MMKGKRNVTRRYLILSLLVLLLTIGSICTLVSAADSTTEISSEAYVAITNVTLDPSILMQYDQGTLSVRITNSGSSPVKINRVELLSEELDVVNYQTYDKVGVLGASNSLVFTFLVEADVKDGTYFPIFYVDFTDSGSMRYPIAVKVDDTPLLVSVVKSPVTFTSDEEDKITLSISNPRDNEVNSVTVVPGGDGISPSQSAVFVGTLKPDEERQVTFGITPEKATVLVLDVLYRNGPNQHNETITLPVMLGNRKVAAELVVNNIEVAGGGASLTISGDVTNAGLKDAKSVTVTVGDPAWAIDPDPVYVVGALEPDDFSSFEITCKAPGLSQIPLVVSYRDDEGEAYQETFDVSALSFGNSTAGGSADGGFQGPPSMQGRPSGGGMGMMGFGSGFSKIPIIPILIVIIAIIGVLVAWRKGYLGKIRERFSK